MAMKIPSFGKFVVNLDVPTRQDALLLWKKQTTTGDSVLYPFYLNMVMLQSLQTVPW